MKRFGLRAVPSAVLTLHLPLVPLRGTVTRILESDGTLKLALTPASLTSVAPPKWWPKSLTVAPGLALNGPKPVMTGFAMGAALGAVTLNIHCAVVMPPAVVTLILFGPTVGMTPPARSLPSGTLKMIRVPAGSTVVV